MLRCVFVFAYLSDITDEVERNREKNCAFPYFYRAFWSFESCTTFVEKLYNFCVKVVQLSRNFSNGAV